MHLYPISRYVSILLLKDKTEDSDEQTHLFNSEMRKKDGVAHGCSGCWVSPPSVHGGPAADTIASFQAVCVRDHPGWRRSDHIHLCCHGNINMEIGALPFPNEEIRL